MQNNGVLRINTIKNSGVASAAGAGNEVIIRNNATLRYTGTGDSTDRTLTMNWTNGRIENDGTGALIWTGAFNHQDLVAGNKTLYLRGDYNGPDANEIQGNLVDSVGGSQLGVYAHQGSLWELNGNNTYTGQTSIYDSGTRLRAGSTTAIGDLSPVVMGSAGILELDGFSNTIGSLQSANGSTAVVNANAADATLTTGGNNASTSYAGIIQDGAGGGLLSLVKEGSGTFTLQTTAKTYTGTTTVNDGTWLMNTSHTGAGDYTVNSGGTLGGSGSIDGSAINATINDGGFLSPGNIAPGTLTFGSAADDVFDISGAVSATDSQSMLFQVGADGTDLLSMANSTLNIGTELLEFDDFNFNYFGLEANTVYTLFDYGTLIGSLGPITTGRVGGFDAEILIQGTDIVLLIGDLLIAPEPSTIMLLASGGFILAVFRRRLRS